MRTTLKFIQPSRGPPCCSRLRQYSWVQAAPHRSAARSSSNSNSGSHLRGCVHADRSRKARDRHIGYAADNPSKRRHLSVGSRNMPNESALSAKKPLRSAKAGYKNETGSRVARLAPKLIAFDLDGTLWWPEMYMLGGSPFRGEQNGRLVTDRSGQQCRLMGASHDILKELVTTDHFKGSKVAYISRCDVPKWANQCLSLFEAASGVTMKQAAHHSEIYPGVKTKHFRKVHRDSGIAYRDMLFFDNEHGNIRDCSAIGITCIYTPDGMTRQKWEEGLQKHAKAVAARSPETRDSVAVHDGPASASSDDEDGNSWGGYWS